MKSAIGAVLACWIAAVAVRASPIFEGLGVPYGCPDSFPTAINADGSVVVGWSDATFAFEERLAFRWTRPGGMEVLPPLPNYFGAYASGVSADGSVVVGTSRRNGEVGTGHLGHHSRHAVPARRTCA